MPKTPKNVYIYEEKNLILKSFILYDDKHKTCYYIKGSKHGLFQPQPYIETIWKTTASRSVCQFGVLLDCF